MKEYGGVGVFTPCYLVQQQEVDVHLRTLKAVLSGKEPHYSTDRDVGGHQNQSQRWGDNNNL